MGLYSNTNIAIDVTLGALTHNLLFPPAVPAPTPVPSIEMIATQMWTLGYLTQKNKFTTTVFHRFNLPIVLEEHDLGMMIPDVTIPPSNYYYAIMWPFSSRKILFVTSKVLMDGKKVGCAQIFLPFPMMTCGDPISAPTSQSMTNLLLDSVQVGLTFLDFFIGLGTAVFSMVLDYVADKLTAGAGGEAADSVRNILMTELAKKLVPTSLPDLGKLLLSGAPDVVAALARGEDPAYKVSIGWPGLSEYEMEISGAAGVSVRRNIGGRQAAEIGVGGEQGAHATLGGPPPSTSSSSSGGSSGAGTSGPGSSNP